MAGAPCSSIPSPRDLLCDAVPGDTFSIVAGGSSSPGVVQRSIGSELARSFSALDAKGAVEAPVYTQRWRPDAVGARYEIRREEKKTADEKYQAQVAEENRKKAIERQKRRDERLRRLAIEGLEDYDAVINELAAAICTDMIECNHIKPLACYRDVAIERLFERALAKLHLTGLFEGERNIEPSRSNGWNCREKVLYPSGSSLREYFGSQHGVVHKWWNYAPNPGTWTGRDKRHGRYYAIAKKTIDTLNNKRGTMVMHLADAMEKKFKEAGYEVQNDIQLGRVENTLYTAHYIGTLDIEVPTVQTP